MPEHSTHVTAVILTYRQPEKVCKVIEHVKAQTLPLTRIIVVDNGSNEQSASKIAGAHPDVELIRLSVNQGVGAGHNAGWRLALEDPNCEFIWALEHDCYPHPDCLAKLVEGYQSLFSRDNSKFSGQLPGVFVAYEVDEVTTSTIPHYHINSMRIKRILQLDSTASRIQSDGFTFNGTLFPTVTVRAIGLLEEKFFFYGEDLEYAMRCRQHGVAIYLEPAARIDHDIHRDSSMQQFGRWVILRPGKGSPFRVYYGNRNTILLARLSHMRGAEIYLRAIASYVIMSFMDLIFGVDKRRRWAARTYALRDGMMGRSGEAKYWFLPQA